MDFVTILVYVSLFLSLYFEVFLLISFFEHKRKDTGRDEVLTDEQLPSVAIIVPCWNEERTISSTISSLLELHYPKHKLELLVVDDGSTDRTHAVASAFADAGNVRVFRKANGGKHSAMNYALENTNSEIVGCLDADSFVEPDALIHLVQHFSDESVASVTPSIKIHNARGLVEIIQKAEYGISIFLRKAFVGLDALFITPGPFSFFRRSAIDSVGHWRDAHSTEDLEMGLRLQKNHMRISNEPRAIVHTTAPNTLYKLYRQRVRWSYGFVRNAWDYRELFFNSVYGNLGMLVLPMAAVSFILAIYLFAVFAMRAVQFVIEQIARFVAIGGVPTSTPTPDAFFISTSTLTIVTVVAIAGTVLAMALGKRLAKDKSFSSDMIAYVALYGFMAPVWITSATIKALARSGVRWR